MVDNIAKLFGAAFGTGLVYFAKGAGFMAGLIVVIELVR